MDKEKGNEQEVKETKAANVKKEPVKKSPKKSKKATTKAVNPTPVAGVYKKILAVMKATGPVVKTGFNDYHKYTYATELAILDTIRDQMIEQGLIVIPNVDNERFEEGIHILNMTFKIIDVEDGSFVKVGMVGSGEDKGDKGAYKALTGANKYFLMKAFLIPTQDDPEREDKRPVRQGSNFKSRAAGEAPSGAAGGSKGSAPVQYSGVKNANLNNVTLAKADMLRKLETQGKVKLDIDLEACSNEDVEKAYSEYLASIKK